MTFAEFIAYMSQTFFPTLWERLLTIILAPTNYPGMIWILFPMVVTLLLMTFYFGRYRHEELGWNTAFGNALVLLFVSIDLLQRVYPQENPLQALLIFLRTLTSEGLRAEGILPGIVAGAVLLYALILLTADFFHWLPKKFAFFISSGLPLNVLSYFGIIFVYSRTSGDNLLVLDWYTLLAFILLFATLWVVLHLLQFIEPHSDEVKELAEEAPEPIRNPVVREEAEQIEPPEIDLEAPPPDDPALR